MIVIGSRSNEKVNYIFDAVELSTDAIEQGHIRKGLTGKVTSSLKVGLKDPSLRLDSEVDSDVYSVYEPGSNPELEEIFKDCCPPEVLNLGNEWSEWCVKYIKFFGWPAHSNQLHVYTVETAKTANEES